MGTVDVERYTGTCLITTAVRPKSRQQQQGDSSSSVDCADGSKVSSLPLNDPRNWAGAPLLSMAASIRKTKPGAKQNWHPPVFIPAPTVIHPDAYAAHLQGAPLIRVPRHPFVPKKVQQQQVAGSRRPNVPASNKPPVPLPPALTPPTNDNIDSSSGCVSSSSDASSVTSDEGLASGGSESSLPRIIKPRNRRRKGHHHQRRTAEASTLSDIDALLSNDGDPLADLFRNNAGISSGNDPAAATTTTTPGPLWPSQDIWSSCSAWNSAWSTARSSSSCWPDQRVIRRPLGHSSGGNNNINSGNTAQNEHKLPGSDLQVSSQLIASPFNGHHRDIEIRFFSSSQNPADAINR